MKQQSNKEDSMDCLVLIGAFLFACFVALVIHSILF